MLRKRSEYIRWAVLFLVVAAIVSGYVYLHIHGLGGRQTVGVLRRTIEGAGVWGPLLVIGIFAAQTFVPIPNIILAVMTGVFYGPLIGSMVVMTGLLVSALVSFLVGRYVGQAWVEARAPLWVKRYRDLLEEHGFTMVMFMRLLQFPADVVGALCGVTRMSIRSYLFASFFGLLPVGVTFTVLGPACTNPRSWILFVTLFLGSIGLALLAKRFRWITK